MSSPLTGSSVVLNQNVVDKVWTKDELEKLPSGVLYKLSSVSFLLPWFFFLVSCPALVDVTHCLALEVINLLTVLTPSALFSS